jgi:pimeloyl-ACP methyl ester carboxylesterase
MATPAERNARMDRCYAGPQTRVKVSASRRLNLLILGEGSPTVIFAPGSGASMLEWMLVQHAVATKTRTVAYDNAGFGFGFSDPGPLPRTASATVNDLKAALEAAHIPPPYVLAGWSWGGLIMRLFAFRYPQEVVGMVMVDSSSEHQMRHLRDDPKVRAWAHAYRRKFRRAEQLARTGDLVAGTPEYDELVSQPNPALTPAVKAAFLAQRTSPGRYRGRASESASQPTTIAEMDAARRPLGDMPLIVLTAGKFFPLPPERSASADAWRDYWHTGHDEIAALSTRGERRIVDTGHAIQVEKPSAVIEAIEDVLAMAKGR